MFKVDCPGCSAPYQVDERRVPPTGLKMRCPKCGDSFYVGRPETSEAEAPSQSATAGPLTPKSAAGKGTLIGAGSINLTGSKKPSSKSAPGAPPVRKPIGASTMIGGAAPPAPARLGQIGLSKSPSLRTSLTGPAIARPPRPAPPRRNAPLGKLAALKPAASAALKPAASAALKAPEPVGTAPSDPPEVVELELDEVVDQGDKAIPAEAGTGARAPSELPDLELESVPPESAGLPVVAQPERDEVLASSQVGSDADLPALSSGGSDLPAAVEGDSDLPAALGSLSSAPEDLDSDLPAALAPPSKSRGPTEEAALPVARSMQVEADLGLDLPSPIAPAPPAFDTAAASDTQLPSLAEGLDLPEVAGDDPVLPQVAGDANASLLLPAVAEEAQLPESAEHSDLPAIGEEDLQLPDLFGGDDAAPLPSRSAAGSFGELSLPIIGEELDEFGDAGTRAGPNSAPVSIDPRAVAETKVEVKPSSGPPTGFELPELDARPASRGSRASLGGFSPSLPEFEADGLLSESPPEGLDDGLDFDSLPPGEPEAEEGAHSGANVSVGPSQEEPQAAVRSSGAGTDYGEVDFGGGDYGGDGFEDSEAPGATLDTDEGMEFGAIPQKDSVPPGETAPQDGFTSIETDGPPVLSRPAAPVGAPAAEPPESRPRSRKWVLGIAAGLALVGIGGGALALVPQFGPFGIHWVSDMMHAEEHAQLMERTVKSVIDERAGDTYRRGKSSIQAAAKGANAAPRYIPIGAYEAYVQYAMVLRFGPDSALQAKASVRVAELLDRGANAQHDPELALALALKHAVAGEWVKARELIQPLTKGGARALDALYALGEVELRAGKPGAARKAWVTALERQNSAWALFGVARSLHALEEDKAAVEMAGNVLSRNPEHPGAHLLLAQLRWGWGDEAGAVKHVDAVLENAPEASRAQTILAHTLLGEVHLGRGRVSRAEGEFVLALKQDPKVARALVGLGDAFYEAGRYAAALARYEAAMATKGEFQKAAKIGVIKSQLALEKIPEARRLAEAIVKLHPKSALVAYWLGKTLLAAGDRELARSEFLRAIQQEEGEPEAVHAYVALAQIYTEDRQADKASELLARAQQTLKESPVLHKALGDVALSQGKYKVALESFQKAHGLDPKEVGALFRVGSTQRRLGQFTVASTTFDEVEKLDPDFPGLPLERGLLLEQSGKADEALKQFEGALSKAPDDLDLRQRVGCGRVSAGRGPEATEMLLALLKKRPKAAEVHHCYGRALFQEEKLMPAIQSLQQAVALDASRAQYHMHLGWVANVAGQVSIADSALDRALELDKGYAEAYWQRGALKLRRGASKDAVKDLRNALALQPGLYAAHAELAQAYYQLGQEPRALAEWHRAVQADSSNATWLFRYGKLLHARHRNREAAQHLTQALELAASRKKPPAWKWQAHQLLAASVKVGPRAVEHWRKFLELGPPDSPYRADAIAALRAAGQTWEE